MAPAARASGANLRRAYDSHRRRLWRQAAALGNDPAVGYNPYRQHRRRQSDYLFVAAALVVVAVLLWWALLG